ncbi:MAG TPA: M15 family metallopeptidase [Caulobacteraceae bacterium]|jgi:D-alanyl-D-alanine dipeptidase
MQRLVGRLAAALWISALASPASAISAPMSAVMAAEAPPSAPDPRIARLIGDYGPSSELLTIYESGGEAFADGRGLHAALLKPAGPTRFVARPPDRPAIDLTFEPGPQAPAVILAGERLARRDVGADVVVAIRAGIHADPAKVRAAALAASPPHEPPPKRSSDLVDIASIDPTIRFDIRYATADNFMGFPLYERPAAYLQRPAAEALGRVQRALRARGYGLLVHDAYRPWFVSKMFWDTTPPDSHMFVADPAAGSRHNRGCAVDLTLYDLASGQPVEMTGRYDEMSRRSYSDYGGGTGRQRWARDLLRRAMEREGFEVLPEEWWHFDYKDWRNYGIGDVPFDALAH